MTHAGVHAEPDRVGVNDSSVTSADEDASLHPWSGGEPNWLWFAPAVGRACALVIGEVAPACQRSLEARFDFIEKVPVAALRSEVACSNPRAHSSSTIGHRDGSVDCVVSNDLVTMWSDSGRPPFRDSDFLAALSGLRRLLRTGGFLFLSGRNARWHRALLRVGHEDPTRAIFRVGAAQRALGDAGFSETRAYFVEPFTVLPASRRASIAYERERLPRKRAPLRALWAATGLYELLYPDAFVLAIK